LPAIGSPVTLTFVWKLNGVTKRTFTSATALSDTFDLSASGNGDSGGAVTVTVTPDDGGRLGAAVSDTATVANTPPTATVSLNRHGPGTKAVLVATAAKADVDANSVTLTYVWRVNGTMKRMYSSSSAVSDSFDLSVAGNGDAGDVIWVDVIPSDGMMYGATVSDTATVAAALTGDANLDGTVNMSDLTIVLTNYNKTGMSWSTGDFTGDGTVDISDLNKLLVNYSVSTGSNAEAAQAAAGAGSPAAAQPASAVAADKLPSLAKITLPPMLANNSRNAAVTAVVAAHDKVLQSAMLDPLMADWAWLDSTGTLGRDHENSKKHDLPLRAMPTDEKAVLITLFHNP
jgi:hypothetical protein